MAVQDAVCARGAAGEHHVELNRWRGSLISTGCRDQPNTVLAYGEASVLEVGLLHVRAERCLLDPFVCSTKEALGISHASPASIASDRTRPRGRVDIARRVGHHQGARPGLRRWGVSRFPPVPKQSLLFSFRRGRFSSTGPFRPRPTEPAASNITPGRRAEQPFCVLAGRAHDRSRSEASKLANARTTCPQGGE